MDTSSSHERAGSTARKPLCSAGPGLTIMAIAALALFGAHSLPLGTAERVGPGAAPTILAALLLVLGIIVAAQALLRPRPDGDA